MRKWLKQMLTAPVTPRGPLYESSYLSTGITDIKELPLKLLKLPNARYKVARVRLKELTKELSWFDDLIRMSASTRKPRNHWGWAYGLVGIGLLSYTFIRVVLPLLEAAIHG